MHIGILTLLDRTKPDGISRYTTVLIRALLAARTEHRFTLFHERDDPGFGDSHRVTNISLGSRRAPVIGGILRNLRMSGAPVDLLHGPYNGVPVGRFKRVITIHDLLPLTTTWPVFSHRFQFRVITPFMARTCDRVMADSRWTAEQVVEHYDVHREKVRVVYPGVEVLRISPGEAHHRRQRLGLPEHYVLAVGNMANPVKNAHGLIAAFARSRARSRGVHLVLAGRPPTYDGPEEIIRKQGIGDIVHMTGSVSEEDLAAIYTGATVLAQPSFGEGFGYPVIEAMVHGVPVIATSAGSVPEVAGDAALIVKPTDTAGWSQSIDHLVDDEALRAELIGRGRRRAETFEPGRIARQVLGIYEEAAAS